MENQIKRHLLTGDSALAALAEKVGQLEIKSTGSVFHDLMSCIIEQQIHYRSTKKQFARLLTAAEIDILSLDNFEQFEEKALDKVKLSTRKFETMGRILTFFAKHSPNWQEMDDESVRKTLGEIKGVGKWTINMILLHTLQRPNIFPADDYHLKLIMASVYAIGPEQKLKSEMLAISEQWAPYKSYGVRYLLAYKAAQKARKA